MDTFQLSVVCDACRSTFEPDSIFYKCVECVEVPVFLCSPCFTLGAQFNDHARSHKCHKGRLLRPSMPVQTEGEFNEKLNFNLLIQFLRGIRKFGFFWDKVANTMPLFGRTKHFSYQSSERIFFSFLKQVLSKPATCQALPIFPRPTIPSDNGPGNFNYLRNEFEYDYMPEAEVFFADSQVPKTPEETEILVSALHAYNALLTERRARKSTLVDCGLISLKDFVPKKKKSDEKDIYDRLRIFVRPARAVDPSVPHGILESLASGLATEKRLREQLARLNTLRRSGVIDEKSGGALYEYETKQREECKKRGFTIIHNDAVSLQDGPGTASKNRKGSIWMVDQLFAADLISVEDKSICEKTGIAPQHFFVIKRTLEELRKANASITVTEATAFVRDAAIGAVSRSQGKKNVSSSEVKELKTLLVEYIWKSIEPPKGEDFVL